MRVYNDRGSFDAAADVSADIMAGIVVAPMGYWARCDGNGRAVNAINPPAFADYGNAPTFSDTLVEVAKHAGARPRPSELLPDSFWVSGSDTSSDGLCMRGIWLGSNLIWPDEIL